MSYLTEKRKNWYSKQHDPLAVGDRIAVLGGFDGGGIGIVHEIKGDEMSHTLFSPNAVYHKPVSEVAWNEKNSRWETNGLGAMRKLGLGGDRCRS